MPTPEAIVAVARSYLGTPFVHQGRQPGLALDCAGLVVVVAKALDAANGFTEFPYGRYPHAKTLERTCEAHMNRIAIEEARPGDVLLMAWEVEPQHVAILSNVGIIHSTAKAGKVVEHALDSLWRSRIRAAYRYVGAD